MEERKYSAAYDFILFLISGLFVVLTTAVVKAQGQTLIPADEGPGSLGEKFRTGQFQLSDIPLYIGYLTNLAIYAAALIAVVFIIYGGYLYIMSPLSENKEAGKNTIFNAILGLVLSILAWFIVNAAIYIATS